jgi:hypothetical protein
MTLGAACNQPAVVKAVLQGAQKRKYPAEAGKLKPDYVRFEREDDSGQLICFCRFTAGNVYDFGTFNVAFRLGGRMELGCQVYYSCRRLGRLPKGTARK